MTKNNTSGLLYGGVPSIFDSRSETYITHGRGGRCWDQKEKEYIDFTSGYGSLSLGHCNPEVNHAVIKQLERGMMFPSNSLLHAKLGLTLKNIFPYADRSLFLKTGSEAVSAAIRLARAFTGKDKIIRCGFGGWHDSVISPLVSWHLYERDPQLPRPVAGVPKTNSEPLVIPWDGEDFQQLKNLFRTHRSDIAALLLDPVQMREPLEDYLRKVEKLVHSEGALFILDETKTGFRVSLSGVQGIYGVQPDITILGKGMSNGFPLSTVIGRAEILDLFIEAKIMGTFNSELASIAAALKTISILERPTTIPHLWKIGQRLIDGINGILNRYELGDDIRAVPYRWPCMPFIWFNHNSKRAQILKPVFYRQLVEAGVLFLPSHMSFTCLAHTAHDVDRTLQIMSDVWKDCLSGKSKNK